MPPKDALLTDTFISKLSDGLVVGSDALLRWSRRRTPSFRISSIITNYCDHGIISRCDWKLLSRSVVGQVAV